MRMLMFSLSTAHVTEETAQWLDAFQPGNLQAPAITVYPKGEYGWFIHVPDEMEFIRKHDDIPEDLMHVMEQARDGDYQWIMFDRDEDILETLPSFSW